MSATVHPPTPDEARALLRSSASAASAVRDIGGNRHAQWLTGHAVAGFSFFAALATADEDVEALVASLAYALALAVLSATLLPGASVTKTGMGRRWTTAMLVWGAVYGTCMIVGLVAFRAEPAFWVPAAVVTALPLAVGALRENRA
jgi:hypothetical protein